MAICRDCNVGQHAHGDSPFCLDARCECDCPGRKTHKGTTVPSDTDILVVTIERLERERASLLASYSALKNDLALLKQGHVRDIARLYGAACPGWAGDFGNIDMLVANIERFHASAIEAVAKNAPAKVTFKDAATKLDVDAVAARVASKIEEDISDRRGLKWEWRQIDSEVRSEILAKWREIVREALSPTVSGSMLSTNDPDVLAIGNWFSLPYEPPAAVRERMVTVALVHKALALEIAKNVPRSADRTACFRKLRESMWTALAALTP